MSEGVQKWFVVITKNVSKIQFYCKKQLRQKSNGNFNFSRALPVIAVWKVTSGLSRCLSGSIVCVLEAGDTAETVHQIENGIKTLDVKNEDNQTASEDNKAEIVRQVENYIKTFDVKNFNYFWEPILHLWVSISEW